jgi:hypothetical protein
MKRNTKIFQRQRKLRAFFQAAPLFFVRAGKLNLARTLVFKSFSSIIFAKFKQRLTGKKRLMARLVLNYCFKAFIKARVLVRLSPRFIRKRYREVPTGARVDLQKRRVWSILAKLVKHSRQNSSEVLTKEVGNIVRRSRNSVILNYRDGFYKKAENARVYIKRTRLPYYKIKNKRPKKKKRIVKVIWFYRDLRAKKTRKIKKPRAYARWLNKDELYFRRLQLYYIRRGESKAKKRFDWLFKNAKKALFKRRSERKLISFVKISKKLDE